MVHVKVGSKEHKLIMISMVIGSIVTFATMYSPQPLISLFSNEYGISPSTASCSISLTTIALGIGLLFVPIVSNRCGRKLVMGSSLFITSFLAIFSSCFDNFYIFLTIRLIEGISIAGFPSIAITYLNEEFSQKSIGSVIGAYVAGTALGGFTGRVVVGALTDLTSWKIALIILGVINFVLSITFCLILPESKNFRKKANMTIKHWAYNIKGCFRNNKLVCVYVIGFMLMGVYIALLDYIGYPLTKAPYNMSQTFFGFIFIVNLLGILSSVWFGKLTDKNLRRNIELLAIICLLSGSLLTLIPNLIIKIIGLAIFVFGFFGGHAVASGWIGLLAPSKYKAQASSFYLMFYYGGSSIVGYFGGFFLQAWGWIGFITFLCLMLFFTTLVIYKTDPMKKYKMIPQHFIISN